MKFCWRITKYNPQYRNPDNTFAKEEWTSYSDIGKTYNNTKLNYNDYLATENLYINAINYLMNCCNISSFQVVELEKQNNRTNNSHNNNEMEIIFNTIKENDWVEQNKLKSLCQLIFREQIWCKLINNKKIYIHFGYDFYMYIGTALPCHKAIKSIRNDGLFVEPFESPYNT